MPRFWETRGLKPLQNFPFPATWIFKFKTKALCTSWYWPEAIRPYRHQLFEPKAIQPVKMASFRPKFLSSILCRNPKAAGPNSFFLHPSCGNMQEGQWTKPFSLHLGHLYFSTPSTQSCNSHHNPKNSRSAPSTPPNPQVPPLHEHPR